MAEKEIHMSFTHYNLGDLRGGEVFEVSLSGTEANVLLMDDYNFRNYRARRSSTYLGGHVKRSPVVLQVPRAGHWHIAVDLGGYPGSVRSNVRQIQ